MIELIIIKITRNYLLGHSFRTIVWRKMEQLQRPAKTEPLYNYISHQGSIFFFFYGGDLDFFKEIDTVIEVSVFLRSTIDFTQNSRRPYYLLKNTYWGENLLGVFLLSGPQKCVVLSSIHNLFDFFNHCLSWLISLSSSPADAPIQRQCSASFNVRGVTFVGPSPTPPSASSIPP